MDAVVRGDLASLKHLLSLGADVNEPDFDGMTALHWAAASEEGSELVEELVKSGADIEVKTPKGYTPLHLHCVKGRYYAVCCLLHYGAKVNARTDSTLTPLHIAVCREHVDISRVLLAYGAKIAAPSEDLKLRLNALIS